MRVRNSTSNYSDGNTRQMIENAIQGFRDYMDMQANYPAAELFDAEEWEFLDDDDEGDKAKGAADGGAAENAQLTAAQVMRDSFTDMAGDRQSTVSGSRQLGTITFSFNGRACLTPTPTTTARNHNRVRAFAPSSIPCSTPYS